MQLSNNTILITDGTSDVSIAIAKKFVKMGSRVVLCADDEHKLIAIKKILPEVEYIDCVLNDDEDFRNLLDITTRLYPDLNILINNSSLPDFYEFNDGYSVLNNIDRELDIHFKRPVKLTATLLPLIKRNKHTAVVNISSILGFMPGKASVVYHASKAGMRMFSESLRHQVENIRVFDFLPLLVKETSGKASAGSINYDRIASALVDGMSRDKFNIATTNARRLKLLKSLSPRFAKKMVNRLNTTLY